MKENCMKETLTVKEASEFTGLKINALYNLMRKRRIPFYKSDGGKLAYFDKYELVKWMRGTRIDTK